MDNAHEETLRATVPLKTNDVDTIDRVLKLIAGGCLVAAFGLLPLFFLPVAYAPFDYTKTLFVIIASLLALIFYSLSVLRSGVLSIASGKALVAFWGVVGAMGVSALLSGDAYDALIGDAFAVHSALFVGLMALVTTTVTLFGREKAFVMRMYIALAASALLVGLYQVLRIVFGPDFLSFGMFTERTSSLLGGWNDLALFFGLLVLLSVVALEQLPLTKWGRILFSVVVGVSLLMLSIVNFFAVWLVLALVSLLVLMYGLTKDHFTPKTVSAFTTAPAPALSISSVVISAVVFIVSLIFVIGGSVVGAGISKVTNISYVEVRPSPEATIDIARSVYAHNIFTGVGPNRFADAWREYKDPSLNNTIFWSTDFNTGSGYIPTQIASTGLLGLIAWLIFLGLFVVTGVRMLIAPLLTDKFWYFIGTSSFVAAAYLWGMSLVYTPGATMLLLTAVFTGITLISASVLRKRAPLVWSIEENRRAGFLLVALVMLVIVASASALYYAGRHYSAIYAFTGAVTGLDGSQTLDEVEQRIAGSFAIVASDQYARQIAFYELNKMNALLALTDPSEAEQAEFQSATANAVSAAGQAAAIDPTNPTNNSTLGAVYSALAAAGVDGAAEKAQEAYAAAREYDPTNPSYDLLEAQLLARTGDMDGARTKAEAAVTLKPDYTDALFFLAQLDIAEGKVADAITKTQAIVRLDPQNPARYYQLGVLYVSNEQWEDAALALERAVSLDRNYANARYFLGVAYSELGETDMAITQFEAVSTLNPDNQQVKDIISTLKGGGTITPPAAATDTQPSTETAPVGTDGETVTTTEAPDTSLISTVNPIDDTAEDAPAE